MGTISGEDLDLLVYQDSPVNISGPQASCASYRQQPGSNEFVRVSQVEQCVVNLEGQPSTESGREFRRAVTIPGLMGRGGLSAAFRPMRMVL